MNELQLYFSVWINLKYIMLIRESKFQKGVIYGYVLQM